MIESASTICSIIDGKPISYSPAHQLVRSLFGCVAVSLTYEDEVLLHPPDEVMNHDRPNLVAMGGTGKHQFYSRGRVPVTAEYPHSLQTPTAG